MYIKRKFNGVIGWASPSKLPPNFLEFIADDDELLGTFLSIHEFDPATGWAGGEFVPAEVTKLQLKRALKAANLLATVEAYVAQANDDTKMAWADGATMPRDDVLVNAAANAMGLDTDALFIAAAKL